MHGGLGCPSTTTYPQTYQNCSIEFMLAQSGRLLRNCGIVAGGLQLLPEETNKW